MISLRFPLIAATVLSACSTPNAISNSIIVKDTALQVTVISPHSTHLIDSLCYVGYIQKFEDKSFYTDLDFKIPNYNDYEKIIKMGDSVIYEDNLTTRTRIPIEKAGQYFNLTGLNWINIFNNENRVITTGKLSHIEFLDESIDGKFVAVFKVDNPNISDFKYCISGSMKYFTPKKNVNITNSELTSKLIDYLHLKRDDYMIVNHYQSIESGTIYSTVSADTTAYIIESLGDKISRLYESKSSELIMGLVIVSKELSGRPILLTTFGLPESDMFWTSLFVYNGIEYEIDKDQRIKNE